MSWQLAEAKNKLSEVVNKALSEGPQRISRRGQVVIMLSEAEYRRLTGATPTLKEVLLAGPDLSELNLARDDAPMREVTW
jgi:prevent-host-death family protein